jgi:hypothetical protein
MFIGFCKKGVRWRRMTHKRQKELQDARLRLEEACIFHDEDIHNVVLEEDAIKLEIVICKG